MECDGEGYFYRYSKQRKRSSRNFSLLSITSWKKKKKQSSKVLQNYLPLSVSLTFVTESMELWGENRTTNLLHKPWVNEEVSLCVSLYGRLLCDSQLALSTIYSNTSELLFVMCVREQSMSVVKALWAFFLCIFHPVYWYTYIFWLQRIDALVDQKQTLKLFLCNEVCGVCCAPA